MRNLPTPLYEPMRPDPETVSILDFWQRELEKLCSEHILRWAFDLFGSELAFASSWGEEDGVICSLLGGIPCRLPVVELIHTLLLPETWTPLTPEETVEKTFDGRTASAELWARFHIEHLCKRNEITIRQYRAWIVPTIRGENPTLATMPVLSWNERFGVLRIAPLARWSKAGIRAKLDRDAVPCDLFLEEVTDREIEQPLLRWPGECLFDLPLEERERNFTESF